MDSETRIKYLTKKPARPPKPKGSSRKKSRRHSLAPKSIIRKEEIVELSISDLKPHPVNQEVYGEKPDVTDLMKRIENDGQLKSIYVNSGGTILSGHRRTAALKKLKKKTVQAIIIDFKTQKEETNFVLSCNSYRPKTRENLIREAMVWEKNNKKDFKATHKYEKLRDKVADLFNLNPGGEKGCGRSYSNAKAVIEFIDEYRATKTGDVDIILKALNHQSIDSAYRSIKVILKIWKLAKLKKGPKKKVGKKLHTTLRDQGVNMAEVKISKMDNPPDSNDKGKGGDVFMKHSRKKFGPSNWKNLDRKDLEKVSRNRPSLNIDLKKFAKDDVGTEKLLKAMEYSFGHQGDVYVEPEPINTNRYEKGKYKKLANYKGVSMKIDEEKGKIHLKAKDEFSDLELIGQLLAGLNRKKLKRMLVIAGHKGEIDTFGGYEEEDFEEEE